MSDRPSITVVVTVSRDMLALSKKVPYTVRPYTAFTIPYVREFQADGISPEDAINGLQKIIKSYTYGTDRYLHSIHSISLDELIVEEVMNS